MVHYLLTDKSMIKKEKTKQTTMDIFMKRVTPNQEDPQAGPWGRIPKEDIANIGDDSSMKVIAYSIQYSNMLYRSVA